MHGRDLFSTLFFYSFGRKNIVNVPGYSEVEYSVARVENHARQATKTQDKKPCSEGFLPFLVCFLTIMKWD